MLMFFHRLYFVVITGSKSVGTAYVTVEAPSAVGIGVICGIVFLAFPILFILILDISKLCGRLLRTN